MRMASATAEMERRAFRNAGLYRHAVAHEVRATEPTWPASPEHPPTRRSVEPGKQLSPRTAPRAMERMRKASANSCAQSCRRDLAERRGEQAIIDQMKSPKHGVMPAWVAAHGDPVVKELAVFVHSLGGGE